MLQTLRAREDRRAKKASRFNHGPAPGGVYVRILRNRNVPYVGGRVGGLNFPLALCTELHCA